MVMRPGSFEWQSVPLIDALDERLKPGVYLQDKAFLYGENRHRLATLEQALALIEMGNAIAAYR
jgi:hypothetical protein